MICHLKGILISRDGDRAVLEVNGTGYEIYMAQASIQSLPETGTETRLFISESSGMYSGITLYGFINQPEKDLFELLRETVPNTGAKKALEYLNKAIKSLPDFQKAVIENDAKLLTGIFGFTAKTAARLVSSLKDKIPELGLGGIERLKNIRDTENAGAVCGRVLSALASLGYNYSESKTAVRTLREEGVESAETVEQLLRRALKKLSVK